jgi:UrcA family protein
MGSYRVGSFVVAAALAIVAAAGVASPARAELAADVPQQKVRFGDLDLSTQAGVRTLYARIRKAAENVCGPATRPGSKIVSEAWQDCVAGAVSRAVHTIDNRSLTAYYFDRARLPFRRAAG